MLTSQLLRPPLPPDRAASRKMAAMPILNRQPEAPYVKGLLVILGLILLAAALRYAPFFLHQVLGFR